MWIADSFEQFLVRFYENYCHDFFKDFIYQPNIPLNTFLIKFGLILTIVLSKNLVNQTFSWGLNSNFLNLLLFDKGRIY